MATIVKDLGAVTAYAYAKEKGYTGTEDEFAELMASYADVAEQAAESASAAAASERNAQTYSQTAVDKALEASGYATTATNKASEAATSASSASGSAATATQKASDASASATAAGNSANAAAGSATDAYNSASAAASSATAASNAQTAAETAQGKAEDAQEEAEAAASSLSASAAQIATNAADISDLKSALRLDHTSGTQTFALYATFEHYGLNSNGTFKTDQEYRVSCTDTITFADDVIVTPASGFKWGYYPYVEGVIGAWNGWFTSATKISAGTTFIVLIARVTEVTSETADVATFLSQITFTTKDTRRIEALEHDNVLLNASIDDIKTGNVTPEYLYKFADFVNDVPTWAGYNESYFTVTDSAVSISANYVFTYKRNFFLYKPSTNITVKFKIAVNSYAGGTNPQQLRITASGYTGSAVQKVITVSADGQTVTYDGNTYALDEDIDVVLALENVSENTSAYVGLNNRNNPSMSPIAYTIKDFEVYYTPTQTRTVVMYANQVLNRRYNGKTWGAIGDSLTAPYYNLYVDYVADALGLTATNYGVGSSDVTYDADETVPSFVARVCGTHGQSGYNDEFDLWTVFGGINDAISGATIGTITDSVETTFYGAMNLIIQHLLGLPNHPTVALIAPYDCANTNEANYITAIKNIGKKYGLPVLDLSEVSGINSTNWSYYLRDSVHPNQNGANKLRPIILEWFERLRLPETTPNMPH